MRTWDEAFELLKYVPTPDYIGGKWPEIRYNKVKALFEIAADVPPGTCIVDLGTWRGLAAFTLALGSDSSIPVYTLDDYQSRRVEEVGRGGQNYEMEDYRIFQDNLGRMPQDVQERIHQEQREVRETADVWTEPVGLVFWDLWGERLHDDVEAWAQRVVPGGLVVVKVFEDGRLNESTLLNIPDLILAKWYDAGKVLVLKKRGGAQRKVEGRAVWIVDGDKYIDEAERSASSVAKHMPGIELGIYQPGTHEHTDWFVESTRLLLKVLESLPNGEKLLWLDSDTYMVRPVPELFDMLDRFDIVLAHAPGHQTAPPRIPIPAAFPEFNIGVIAMENNSHIREMWNSVYQRQKDGIATDQAALREVLWEEDPDVLYAVMPWEYNCRFGIGTFLRDPVKILHGRAASAAEYEQIAIDLNAGFHVSE